MRRPWKRFGAAWLWCFSGIGGIGGNCAAGLDLTISPEQVDVLFFIPLSDIGLAPGAVVSVNISSSLPTNDTLVVILSHGQWTAWLKLVNHAWKKLPGGFHSTYLISHWRQPFSGELVARHTICAAGPDRYYVVVVNTHSQAMVVQGSIGYVNPGGQHLPLQLEHLPETLWASFVAFVLLLLAVVVLLSSVWQKDATLLHALLVACLWLKSVALALKWKCYSVLEAEGSAPEWLYQVWHLVAKLHEISEIFLLLITALGWRVLRPRLTATEIRFAALAMILAATLASLEVWSEAAQTDPLVSFRLLFYIVRVVCYLVIIFAMNFNLQLIALHLSESPVTHQIAMLYRKQQAYIGFRRIFLVIVFKPSVELWLQLAVLDEQGTRWAVDAFKEGSEWLIYASLFATLRPRMAHSRLSKLIRTVIASDQSAQAGDSGVAGAAALEAQPGPQLDPQLVPQPIGIAPGDGGGGDPGPTLGGPEAGSTTPYVRLVDAE